MLALEPLEPEGGYYRRTYGSAEDHGSAIYYLIDDQNFSQLHRLKCDEIFHFYSGEPAELILMNETSGEVITKTLGPDLSQRHECQVLVPAGTWQGMRVKNPTNLGTIGNDLFPELYF